MIPITDEHKFLIDINLSFFAEGEGGEKTEQPTSKKRNKARDEGQVAKSPEIAVAFMLIVIFSAMRSFAGNMYEQMLILFTFNFGMVTDMTNITDVNYMSRYISFTFTKIIVMLIPIFSVAMIVGIITNLIQVGWHPTTKPLKVKFSKLNPLNGAKRLFKVTQFVELLKSIIKLAFVLIMLYNLMADEIEKIIGLYELGLIEAVMYIGDLMMSLGVNVGIMYLFIAMADYVYAKFQHTKSLKMTKQEVKDEYKEAEGNPQIKGKIRQKMREASMRRMMQELPKADVIITNPTHYAVALGYNRENAGAPVVLAKGADFVAKRIREFATKYDIVIVENKQLARTLYQLVDLGQEIPPELYQTVAEVLAYVYKLKNKVS